jgi:hypothetical protein
VSAREVFCDSLTWRSALALARSAPGTVRVLDDIPATLSSALLRRLLALCGCRVVETEFFAGHLRGDGGEPLFAIASRRTSEAALDAARAAIDASPWLAAINGRCGRDRLILRMARQYWLQLGRQVAQIHVARALAGSGDVLLWLARPTRYDQRVLQGIDASVEVRHYDAVNPVLERMRLAGWVLGLAGRTLYWRMLSVCSRPPARLRDPAGRPGLLLIQEDQVSADHSYRTQPHWFPPAGAPAPPFATYLLAGGASPAPEPATTPRDLTVLDERGLAYIDRCAAEDATTSRLREDARRCARLTVTAQADWVRTGYAIAARLLVRARVFAKACSVLNIRAFLSGEMYLFDSDAIHAIGTEMNVTTVTFQYSNLAYSNVIAAATSDHMMLFSERFARIWPHRGFGAEGFTAIGYPFDAAFARVRERSARWRRRLESAGARFIVCYFDENVGPPKYGFIAPSDLDGEIRVLARRVLDDPGLGVVFKSQFRKRSPTVRLASDPLLDAAIATGRMIDLCEGSHRNIVLPAEAALASDMAISHVIGGTAAVESALAGTRCVLINFNGLKTANDELYARGFVVFDSIENALGAIEKFRAGDARYAALGDWSAFLHELDPFRDGRAAERLRETLEAIVCGRALENEGTELQAQARA